MEFKNSKNLPLFFAAFFGFTGVAFGAFGAHGLKAILSPDLLIIFETGARYQLIHSVVLVILALSNKWSESKELRIGYWLIFSGILIFSGSLYTLSITGIKVLGAITPFGGIAFLLGWGFLGYSGIKGR
ncbi:PF04241 family protein [Leptospira inadai serovar Lyme str. 10]|uniref:PF04241 family protein n=2 Tax=Leptospira inadai serovar Lyme TaxID=293084 RepID=V6H8I7_9LEPT|nr:DUF423 domain-containing protein [Leptospira inadai]EQA35241.1 PF04241 family protein [Leptospira inadai serovar Lyme str. 10]PNV75409.1 DUF423 domain-containing protein [Leptospira inadai serovar Lyme]